MTSKYKSCSDLTFTTQMFMLQGRTGFFFGTTLAWGMDLSLLEEDADICAENLLQINYFCWYLFNFTSTSLGLTCTHGKTRDTWDKEHTSTAQRAQGQENLSSDTGLWACVSLTQCFHLYWEKRGIKNLIALLVVLCIQDSKQTHPSFGKHREQGACSSHQQVLFKKQPK